MKRIATASWVCVLAALLGGCEMQDESIVTKQPPPEAAPEEEATSYCLDPADPAVHYRSDDPVVCRGLTLKCQVAQFGFDNACGCGCIDKAKLGCPAPTDPEISWKSHDPSACNSEPHECALGQLGFSNGCGCGCIQH